METDGDKERSEAHERNMERESEEAAEIAQPLDTEALQEAAENEVDKLAEDISGPAFDESGAIEAAEYAGINLPEEDTEVKAVDLTSTQVESVEEEEVDQGKYIPEPPITHLKHQSGKVFEQNPDLMKRRDLIPCDKDGKKVYDHRVF